MQRLLFPFVLLVCSSHFASAQQTIFIVRHAEKAQGGDAKDPELSEAGRARAESLSRALKDAGIAAIYATEFKRTQQTAEPIARAAKLEVTTVPANETSALIAKLKQTDGNALVVAHSNTIPEIAKALGAPIVFAVNETDYDDLFVLATGPQPQLIRLHLPVARD